MTFDLLALAREIIAIDTRSSISNIALIEFMLPLCREAGLETSLQEEIRDGVRQYNLLAFREPLDQDTLLLAAHTDTVPPGDASLWTATAGDPFSLTEGEGLLYGLGTADVKLDLLCKLLAVESLRNADLRKHVALAATYGEETGRYGAKLLVRELGGKGGGALPFSILVGEPTDLRPCAAHKGYVEFRTEGRDPAPCSPPCLPCWLLVFGGVAAHSSQPHRGASANTACLDALESLRESAKATQGDDPFGIVSVRGGDAANKVSARCEAIVVSSVPPDVNTLLTPVATATGVTCIAEPVRLRDGTVWSPELGGLLLAVHALTRSLGQKMRAFQVAGFDPPYSTVNNGLVTLDQGRLSYISDVRPVPGRSPSRLIDEHEASLTALEEPSLIRNGGLRLRTKRDLESPPFQAIDKSPLLAALMVELGKRGLPLEPEMKSGTTEAPIYQATGMDTIVFGPGQAAGNIHKPNERVALSDLYRSIEIYRDLIIRVCGT